MLYVAPSHPPSAQLQALKLNLFSPDHETLVLNKLNRLEFSDIDPAAPSDDVTKLALRDQLKIHAGISSLAAVTLPGHSLSSLLLLTTSLHLALLSLSPSSRSIQTLSHTSLAEPYSRLSEYQTIQVSPCGQVAVVYAYHGLLRVIPLLPTQGGKAGAGGRKAKRRRSSTTAVADATSAAEGETEIDLSTSYNLRLRALNILSIAFLPSPPEPSTAHRHPTLAILSTSPSSSSSRILSTHTLNLDTKELEDDLSALVGVEEGEVEVQDPGAEMILPISGGEKGPTGSLVVGEESLVFFPRSHAEESGDEEEAEGKGKGKGKGRENEGASKAGRRGKGAGLVLKAKLPVSRITASTPLSPTTHLLSDLYGKILLLTFSASPSGTSSPSPSSLEIRDLGDATSASSLVPLSSPSSPGNGILVYLASRFGDSQVIRVRVPELGTSVGDGEKMEVEEERGGGKEELELELVDSFAGLAPIVDAVVLGASSTPSSSANPSSTSTTSASMSNNNNNGLLLLSGAYKTGSLRLLRHGISLRRLAELDLDGGGGGRGVWAVQGEGEAGEEKLLVLADGGAAPTVLKITVAGGEEGEQEVEVEELEDVAPFKPSSSSSGGGQGTLLAARLSTLLIHVTPAGISYAPSSSMSGGSEVGIWKPANGKKVTNATARGRKVAVAVEGGGVVVLEEEEENGGLKEIGSSSFETDLSSLTFSSTTSHLALSLWTPSQTVHILALPSMEIVASHTLSSGFLIRSIALPSFSTPGTGEGETILFCGLGDGSLTSYSVSLDPTSSSSSTPTPAVTIDLKSEKTVQLGRKPLQLYPIPAVKGGEEGERVMVVGERPTVVGWKKGRVGFEGVDCEDLLSLAALPSSSSASSRLLALLSPTSLSLSLLPSSSSSSTGNLNITTIPLDEDEPRRVAYDSKAGVLGVVCSKRDVDRGSGEQRIEGRVRIVEEDGFNTRATYTLPPNTEPQSILFLPSPSSTSSLFLIGSVTLPTPSPTDSSNPPSEEPTSGTLHLVRTTSGSSEVELLAAKPIGGCPYALAPLIGGAELEEKGYIAVAVNSQVAVLQIQQQEQGGENDDSGWTLDVVATWSGAFVALNLSSASQGRLVVSDALRSVAVLRFSVVPVAAGSAAGPAAVEEGGASKKKMKGKLEELAKDYKSRYMVGAEALSVRSLSQGIGGEDKDQDQLERYLGAETDLNLFTVERDVMAGVRDQRLEGVLGMGGGWHLGEVVTRFRKGSFAPHLSSTSDSTLSINPELIYTTSAGSVGVILDLDEETGRLLSEVERNLRRWEEGKEVAGVGQESFRSPKSSLSTPHSSTATGPVGFIDGAFVSSFLDLSSEEQDQVLKGRSEHEEIKVGREEVGRVLEEVGRAC